MSFFHKGRNTEFSNVHECQKWTFKLESGKLVKPDNRAGDLTVYPVKLKGARRQVYVGFPEFSNKMFDGDLEDF